MLLSNYFKTGLRAVLRQKLPSLLNAGGMAAAIGCCLVVYAFFDLALRCDDFHPNVNRIAVAHRVLDNNGSLEAWCDTPEPFGPALLAQTPAVAQVCRFSDRNGLVREADGDLFQQGLTFVDSTFFDFFAFPMKWGRAADFQGRTAMVLTEELAEKYFGAGNPVGRRLSIRFTVKSETYDQDYQIVGVLEKLPTKSSFQFQALIPYEGLRLLGHEDFNDWKRSADATFVLLRRPEDFSKLAAAATPLTAVQNKADRIAPVKSFGFSLLSRITTESADMRRSIFNNAPVSVLVLLGSIAAGMLLLVCFNYINIAMAASTVRLREISIRKVVGSGRGQIVAQFLAEHTIVCLVALGAGLLLAHWVFQPWFNHLIDIELVLDYADPVLWTFLAALLTVSVLGAAAYPAFYVSSLHPVTIFKNKIRLGEKNRLRRALVGMQFLLTFITLFCATVMLTEGPRIRSQEWGYRQNDLLVLPLPNAKPFEAMKNGVQALSDVLAVAGSGSHFGGVSKAVVVESEGEKLQVRELLVGPNYLETLDVPLLSGQLFRPGADTSQVAVLVNAAFRRGMGEPSVLGKTLRLDGRQYTIAGELPDFHYRAFDRKVEPAVLRMSKPEDLRYLTLRVRPGTAEAMLPALQGLWKQHFPDAPFDYFYQNNVFEHYFRGFGNITNLMTATASLAILLSACGIFGLAMLRLMRRVRELSVRRVLGAGFGHFARQVGGEFVWLLAGAGVLGAALGIWIMETILEMFSVGYALAPALPVTLTCGVLLLVVCFALGIHLWRLWRMNPVEALKED